MSEKLKVIAELKLFAIEHNSGKINWIDEECWANRRYIMLDCKDKSVFANAYFSTLKHADIYFTSQEIAEEAIKAIGEERLRKYYFEEVN